VIKVAHIVGSLNIGGAERFVIDLCRVQKRSGDKPAIISLGQPIDPLVAECIITNIPVASYNGGSMWKLVRIFLVLLKFDVIHIHSPHALKFLNVILPLLNKKNIYTRHGAAPLTSPKLMELHREASAYVDAITFVSLEGANNFHQQHSWKDVPSVVIDNSVLIKPQAKMTKKTHKLRLGSVGRMIPLKNQLALLKAVQLLSKKSQKNIELHFFGDGECLAYLKSFKDKHLACVEVNFHGMVTDREQIYSNFDVLVVSSETEGLSMVIIEAMANHIPVIATNVGGNPKLVIDNQTGWLFEFSDVQKLASILLHLMDNKQLITDFGDMAFNYISENFAIKTAAKKYAQLYQR
jgi:glycosyltransferase involved in cell wall biosynthesis